MVVFEADGSKQLSCKAVRVKAVQQLHCVKWALSHDAFEKDLVPTAYIAKQTPNLGLKVFFFPILPLIFKCISKVCRSFSIWIIY